jgi:putative spermidine/putrescine transport system ATP-binding protein
MVFQNYALFPHMSVFENIAFPLRMRRMEQARIREAVQRVLAVIRLPEVAQRFPRQLSGGQQQRVALARALVYEPSIVLLDEPLGALDKKLREQLQLEIKRLHGELGLAMLYVTHDQEEALVMSDRICLMRDGRIEQLGTPEELYFRPHSLFAADFLGESNLLAGRVVDTEATMARVRLHDGIELRGVCGQPLEVGQRARVMIRPEAIRIADRAGPAEAGLRARLVESVMCGSTTKWFLRTASGAELKAQVLTGTFAGRGLPQGEVFLAWSDQSAVVLADV